MARLRSRKRPRPVRHHAFQERHLARRTPWLRAAVLGANDGLISTAALMVGVAAADGARSPVLVAGFAGLAAGALSMAQGEYVSVSTQRDAELADLDKERLELYLTPEEEREEIERIYRHRGLSPELATEVAEQLSAVNPLELHAREELGIDLDQLARPVQAAVTSAISFTLGALVPIVVALVATGHVRFWATLVTTVAGLCGLGLGGARLGGASPVRAILRSAAFGVGALLVSLFLGHLLGGAF
jgi:VIT1/CCC1 family predicted Fe2+/Mn2+ transporter